MEGEKYLGKRLRAMEQSHGPVISGIILRVFLITLILMSGYLFCDNGLKFVEDHPEFDCTK